MLLCLLCAPFTLFLFIFPFFSTVHAHTLVNTLAFMCSIYKSLLYMLISLLINDALLCVTVGALTLFSRLFCMEGSVISNSILLLNANGQ